MSWEQLISKQKKMGNKVGGIEGFLNKQNTTIAMNKRGVIVRYPDGETMDEYLSLTDAVFALKRAGWKISPATASRICKSGQANKYGLRISYSK